MNHNLICPYCRSHKIIKNGHPHSDKLQYYCHSCKKYFSEDVAKGYPTTNIPFPIIAYLLYFHKKIPRFSNTRIYKKFVTQWLQCFGIKDTEISRQLLRHWFIHYEKNLEDIISFEEAKKYCKTLLTQKIKHVPKQDIQSRSLSHITVLTLLEETYGKPFCLTLSQKEEEIFTEFCGIIRKFPVYCSKLLDKDIIQRERRLFFERAKKM